MSSLKVGVLGGGQLGRMLVESANRLNIQISILDAKDAPAKQISGHDRHVEGSFKEEQDVQKLASICDVLTAEIEHVDTYALERVAGKVRVEPSWESIRTIQDKYRQKEYLKRYGIPMVEHQELQEGSENELRAIGEELGYPLMLKSKTLAYDGRGNFAVRTAEDIAAALEALRDRPLYAEKWVPFRMELAVMVVKTKDGVESFPTVETVQEDSICKLVYAPARNVSNTINEKAQELARKAVAAFDGKGVFGVEMFLLEDDNLLLCELACRVHNSGHYTIEACPISQFDAHLRSILDLPIPSESLRPRQPAIMLNILGGSTPDAHLKVAERAMSIPNAGIHLYGKGEGRPGRKMGHITITAATMHEAESHIQPLIELTNSLRGVSPPKPLSPSFSKQDEAMTYASAGVSIDVGNSLVERIKPLVRSTRRPGADAEIGGFGGAFNLAAAGYTGPLKVMAATDGVGTKLLVAQAMRKHDTVGIDLVAMSVNDLIAVGSESLFFLDYFACSVLDIDTAAEFVKGVTVGCIEAGCALLGGETAEMPGLYSGEDYDAAGFAVGAIRGDGAELPRRESMVEGDVLLGLASSGVHSNGFSLVRKILERTGFDLHSDAPWEKGTSIGLSLLTPTRIYVKSLHRVVEKNLVKGLAHITGGGLLENIPRMLPKSNHLVAEVDVETWDLPPIFAWLKMAGNVQARELARAFNCGIGMVLVVGREEVEKVRASLEESGESVFRIGRLVKRKEEEEACVLKGLDRWDVDR